MKDGFGLAHLKPEGHVVDIDTGINTPSLAKEFHDVWFMVDLPWYLEVFRPKIRAIAHHIWNRALIEKARSEVIRPPKKPLFANLKKNKKFGE